MRRFLLAFVAASAIGGGVYALTASGAQTPQFVYGGGHFNVNLCDGCTSPPRDFSVTAEGPNDGATGRILAGMDQSGGGGLSITVLCFAVSPTPNDSGGRTAVVGGTIDSGQLAGWQLVFFVQDNAVPGGPAGVYDKASAFYVDPSGILVVKNKKTTCPDPDSTTAGAPGDETAVRYADVTSGDVVIGG